MKRHFVCKELNLKTIFSMKVDTILSRNDIKKLKLYESYINYKIPSDLITPKVVWFSIGKVYESQRSDNFSKDAKMFGNYRHTLPLVRQAIKYAIDSKIVEKYTNSSPIEKI